MQHVHVSTLVQFLHVCVENTLNFVLKLSKLVEKMITDGDRLLLVVIIKKISPQILLKLNFFLFFEPKVVCLRPISPSLLFLKF